MVRCVLATLGFGALAALGIAGIIRTGRLERRLVTDVEQLGAAIAGLNANVTTLQAQIAGLGVDVQEAAARIEEKLAQAGEGPDLTDELGALGTVSEQLAAAAETLQATGEAIDLIGADAQPPPVTPPPDAPPDVQPPLPPGEDSPGGATSGIR